METFSALLAICAGNSPVTGEFPTQSPVTRSFDVFFDLRPNERLSKQSWGWYRVHYDVIVMFYRHGLDTSRHETESFRILLIRFSSGNLRSKRSKVNDYHNRKFFDRYKWLRNWGRLNIKMSCQYKDCHHKDKTVSQTCVEIWKYGITVLEDCPGVLNTLILTHSSKIFAIL